MTKKPTMTKKPETMTRVVKRRIASPKDDIDRARKTKDDLSTLLFYKLKSQKKQQKQQQTIQDEISNQFKKFEDKLLIALTNKNEQNKGSDSREDTGIPATGSRERREQYEHDSEDEPIAEEKASGSSIVKIPSFKETREFRSKAPIVTKSIQQTTQKRQRDYSQFF